MIRRSCLPLLLLCTLLVGSASSRPTTWEPLQLAPIEDEDQGLVGDVDGTVLEPSKALQDTVWIADWSFDGGAGCTSAGWVQQDLRILNDGSNYWVVNNAFADSFGISGNAVMLRGHNICWERDGYPDDADYSIVLKYRGNASISFRYLSDTEPTYDYVIIEADSSGASEGRVNYGVNPKLVPADFREELARFDDLNMAIASFSVAGATLPDFGLPTVTHELYIRVISDGAASDEDGQFESRWNAAVVVDNIVVTGAIAYSEDFDGPIDPNIALINSGASSPFGISARLFAYITDNDKCGENPTCAWLGTDPTRIAFFPNMSFGPGSAVIRNWLEDFVVSPWVSLASTPGATGTILSFRRFPGNLFAQGRIVQNWPVRCKLRTANTDTTTPGDSIDCLSLWGRWTRFNSLDPFVWGTAIFDITTNFSSLGREIQVAFRNTDWQLLTGIGPPATLNPGPGPYVDRVRIGRRVLNGPAFNVGIDTRTQAQDCLTTVQNAITPGEHFSPAATDIFGTCAFSAGTEPLRFGHSTTTSPSLITGDSIYVESIFDVRGAGGITLVKWYGAITSGPHAGKAPPPYTIGVNGFFEVTPDSARFPGTNIDPGSYFVDFDETYFRGGDALKYFWYAGDAQGGRSSAPAGIGVSLPANVAVAEAATGGLFEVNFLPTINWAPAYLARIAADPHGDLAPTGLELAASSQANCILYYQHTTSNRRSGPLNRTSFMYTLDRLGYRGYYDVYDVQGYGNTNNQLGGRATVAQCSRYSLIIEDDQRSNLVPNIADGSNIETEKINQAQWYRDYLAQGGSGLAGVANLWIIGETTAFEKSTNALFTADMGLSSIVTNQGVNVNPNVSGLGSFTFTGGGVANFAGDEFLLNGGCPVVRNYDGATNTGTAVMTHRYTMGTANGPGAVIMNKNAVFGWNSIWMGFGWFDIRDATGAPPNSPNGTPDVRLMRKILNAALPLGCVRGEDPTGVPDPGAEIAAPRATTLHQNVPNPFNPTTRITFDLARDGHVNLQVFDVAGHLVRRLASDRMNRGFNQEVTWNGLDEQGLRVPSGVYFYQLVTEDYTATRKMVMLK